MSTGWNITCSTTATTVPTYGRVLVGMQVPPDEMGQFREFLKNLGLRPLGRKPEPGLQLFLG